MVDQNPKFRKKGMGRSAGKTITTIIEVVAVIVIIYLIASWAMSSLAVTGVTGSTTFTLTNATTLFTLAGSEYSTSLISVSTLNSTAQITLTRQPTFLNPTYYVIISLNNATNVNGVGQHANMQIRLLSITGKSAQIQIVPISANLSLSPDLSKITVAQTSLSPFGTQASTIPTSSTTSSTTSTTSTSTTTTSTSSSTTTTTISGTNTGHAQALALLKTNSYYGLMLNYTQIYANSTQCTSVQYTSAYVTHFGHSPTGPNTFQNVSVLVPYAMVLNITNSTVVNYVATFSTKSYTPAVTGGPAIALTMNLANNQITGTAIEGVYSGLSYSDLKSGLQAAIAIGNICGILVTSASP
ncbi:MAG: hypothetical protein ACHQX1_01680 [Candidatus Micrarchaeales archaeon]